MRYEIIKSTILTIAAISFCVAAFGQKPDKLSSQQWRLTQINGVRVTSTRAFIEITTDRTRFSGNTGCNRMFGSVKVTSTQIRFTQIGTTRMACIPGVDKLERDVVQTLPKVTRYRQAGNTLEFYRGNRLVMKFTAMVKEEDPGNSDTSKIRLEDRKWILEQIGTQQNVKALPEAFASFDAKKGSVGGNSSCNVFGGSYTTTGDRIRISNLISTMRACIEDEKMMVERQFLDGLRDANRYEIRDGRLSLYGDKQLLLTFRGETK